MPTGAQALVRSLEEAGVRVVFGLPGVHNLAAWDALRESSIRLIGVRHEQAAVYAADGWSRATGELGVALVTTGPGAANTLGATGEAWAGRSPVVVIATDVPSALRRPGIVGGALHEPADQRAMFAPVTKGTFGFEGLQAALRLALEPPARPVFVEVPADLLAGPAPALRPAGRAPSYGVRAVDVSAACEALARASRPLLWVGGGAVAAGAGEAIAVLAERLQAPILTTYSARGVVGRHHLEAGLPPHLPEVGALWEAADAVIAIGSDLDGMSTMNWRLPPPRSLLAINIDAADAAKNYGPSVIVEADAREGCEALAAVVGAREAPWVDLEALRAEVLARLRGEHPEELAFLDAFAAATPDDAVVIADMCIPGYWLAALHRPAAPRRFQYPMGWGTLGYAFPAALGTAVRGPVVSVSGDGGFLFACGELATAKQERLPLTAVVVDDGGYGMLRYDQRHAGTQPYGVDLHTPDFVKLAEAFGVRAQAVDGLADAFSSALAEHAADAEATMLVARAALTPPPTTSPRWHRTGPPAWSGPAA